MLLFSQYIIFLSDIIEQYISNVIYNSDNNENYYNSHNNYDKCDYINKKIKII